MPLNYWAILKAWNWSQACKTYYVFLAWKLTKTIITLHSKIRQAPTDLHTQAYKNIISWTKGMGEHEA